MSLQFICPGGYKKNNITSVTLVNNTAKTIDLTPGAGKRWILLGMRAVNPDDVARAYTCRHYAEAAATNILSKIFGDSLNAGAEIFWPNNDDLAQSIVNASHLRIIEDAEILRSLWGAGGASSGGTDADALVCEVLEIVKGSA